MSSYWDRHPYVYGRSPIAFTSQRLASRSFQNEYNEWEIFQGVYWGRIPPLEALKHGLLHPPRNVNALPHDLYDKPSLIDYERWNKVMDDLREQGVILPWDVAFDTPTSWDREPLDQRRVRHASKKKAREMPRDTSGQRTENDEDINQHSPQPTSPSTRSESPINTEPLLEPTGEAKLNKTGEVTEGEYAYEASEGQQESEPLLEDTEQPNVHPQDRRVLPTWAAVFRDYGRIVSRVVVYGLAGLF